MMQDACADLQVLQQARDVILVRTEDVIDEWHSLSQERLDKHSAALCTGIGYADTPEKRKHAVHVQ